jgi:hypothetical protein
MAFGYMSTQLTRSDKFPGTELTVEFTLVYLLNLDFLESTRLLDFSRPSSLRFDHRNFFSLSHGDLQKIFL